MNSGYTRVVTNAGSLQVGDVVFEHKERIVEIYKQTHSECFCQLRWTGNDQHGSVRYHVINSVNGLVLVTAGPTLDAANAKGDLPTTPTGQPIWKRESEEEKEDSKYQKANAPRIEVRFIRFSPFDLDAQYVGKTAVETARQRVDEFTALLNDGWHVTTEAFDMEEHQYLARLEREAANS